MAEDSLAPAIAEDAIIPPPDIMLPPAIPENPFTPPPAVTNRAGPLPPVAVRTFCHPSVGRSSSCPALRQICNYLLFFGIGVSE